MNVGGACCLGAAAARACAGKLLSAGADRAETRRAQNTGRATDAACWLLQRREGQQRCEVRWLKIKKAPREATAISHPPGIWHRSYQGEIECPAGGYGRHPAHRDCAKPTHSSCENAFTHFGSGSDAVPLVDAMPCVAQRTGAAGGCA